MRLRSQRARQFLARANPQSELLNLERREFLQGIGAVRNKAGHRRGSVAVRHGCHVEGIVSPASGAVHSRNFICRCRSKRFPDREPAARSCSRIERAIWQSES
jgi:hypothetical protein